MSVVTGIMLLTSVSDDDAIAEVQAWMAEHLRGQQLKDVSDGAGGWKHPQFNALSAGINGFVEEDEFAAFVLSRDWWHPESVILCLQPEEGETRVFRPGNYGLSELAVEKPIPPGFVDHGAGGIWPKGSSQDTTLREIRKGRMAD